VQRRSREAGAGAAQVPLVLPVAIALVFWQQMGLKIPPPTPMMLTNNGRREHVEAV
jgi:hypothetical protein